MILLAAAALYPMLAVFEAEVRAQSTRLGIEPARVEIVAPLQRRDRWAWVGQCRQASACDVVIYVRTDVLQWVGYDAIRMVAYHEVLHLWRGDNLDSRWTLETPEALKYQENVHAEIEKRLIRQFDPDTVDAAARDVWRWNQRWAR